MPSVLPGGAYRHLIHGYVLLSPAIPRAPSMRQGTAGGWAKVSLLKILSLSFLNLFGIRSFNHLPVIQFNLPNEFCNGKETLSYSFNLNCSYHPRHPYQTDMNAVADRSLVLIGSEDEANDPFQFLSMMPCVEILQGVKHLEIVFNDHAMEKTANWINELN
ncbi:MAG: hypothetical protein LW832_04170 [Parachlamydia sp.]|nr:hypothetical protein [Parachlamydia sp.]